MPAPTFTGLDAAMVRDETAGYQFTTITYSLPQMMRLATLFDRHRRSYERTLSAALDDHIFPWATTARSVTIVAGFIDKLAMCDLGHDLENQIRFVFGFSTFGPEQRMHILDAPDVRFNNRTQFTVDRSAPVPYDEFVFTQPEPTKPRPVEIPPLDWQDKVPV